MEILPYFEIVAVEPGEPDVGRDPEDDKSMTLKGFWRVGDECTGRPDK